MRIVPFSNALLMNDIGPPATPYLGILAVLVLSVSGGCHAMLSPKAATPTHRLAPIPEEMPRELSKTVLPEYVVEPPDVLVIDALHVVPKAPYQLRTQDVLAIEVPGTLPDYPISGAFPIQVGGMVTLGYPYGSVQVGGKTLEQARTAIEEQLSEQLSQPAANVSLLQFSGQQEIAGEHLVKPDGTVTLGVYGSVSVVGLTLREARQVIEEHLSRFLEGPQVAVDVFAYNSKVYYVIAEGAGLGDRITRLPITGGETVLDAISNVNGLDSFSSKRIWIARPTPHSNDVQILPVDWESITSYATTATNYQVLPGDRIFIAENKFVAFDTGLGKFTAPLERIMGFVLLGTNTASRLSGDVLDSGTRGFGGGTF